VVELSRLCGRAMMRSSLVLPMLDPFAPTFPQKCLLILELARTAYFSSKTYKLQENTKTTENRKL
jgi:hypothetical protein